MHIYIYNYVYVIYIYIMDIILTPTLTISHDGCFHRSANHLTHIPGWCPNMANFQKKIHCRSGLKDPLEQHLAGWEHIG